MKRTKLSIAFTLVVFVALSGFSLISSQTAHAGDTSPTREPFMTMTDCSTVKEISVSECEALVALYDSTNGASWTNHTNWKTNNTPCDSTNGWYGVTCDNSTPKKITQISLSNNGLTGTLPDQIGNLVNVQNLNLNTNSITGSIPASIGNLSALNYLYLSYNDFSGNIPVEITKLNNLLTLDLMENALTGTIPVELGSMTGLQLLYLGGNDLSGNIPTELGGMTNLVDLWLQGNNLDGTIPVTIGNLSHLEYLMLSHNQLTGTIPPELGNLSHLSVLYLQQNQLSGSIPPELGSLTNLRQLYLYENLLTGSIPGEIGNLTYLTFLSLADNQISGSVPATLGSLTSLQSFHLEDNPLSGSLPLTLSALGVLNSLYYNNTSLCAPQDATFQAWLGAIPDKVITWNCLAAPVKTGPANNIFTKDTTPKFTWQSQMSGEKYQILVDNDSDFSSPTLKASGFLTPYKTFTTLLAQGAYYWKVRAQDPGGNWSPWSTKWKFTVDTTPPGKPTLLTPINGSKTSDRTPTFTWKALTGAKYYQLVVDDNADFSSPVFTSSWMTSTSKTLGTPLAPKVYYWRVRAKDTAGNIGAWSLAWKLTIK